MEGWSEYPLHEFDIRREGRAWSGEEVQRKWREHPEVPEKIEVLGGKIFSSEGQRITMLGWMLEQVGADAAVRLGDDPEVWREAVDAAHGPRRGRGQRGGGVEEEEEGWLGRVPEPWASKLKVEIYSQARKARRLLENALDEEEYRRARQEVRRMGFDPDRMEHDPLIDPPPPAE